MDMAGTAAPRHRLHQGRLCVHRAATKALAALVREGVLREQTVGNARRYARAGWGDGGAAPGPGTDVLRLS